MRRKITIPADGVEEPFDLVGNSLVIEVAPVYAGPEDVPILGFDSGHDKYPIYPLARYPGPRGGYQKVRITGTAESAGDEIYVFSSDQCQDLEFAPNFGGNQLAGVGTTFSTYQGSDSTQSLAEVDLVDADGRRPSKIFIWVTGGATRGINYSFNIGPSQGFGATDAYYQDNDPAHDTGAGDEVRFEPLVIEGWEWIKAFRFKATIATETPTLVITAEY